MSAAENSNRVLLFILASSLLMLGIPSVASAQNTVTMTGSIFIGNPDAGAARTAQLTSATIMTNTGTGAVRDITFPASKWAQTGSVMRVFSAFPGVAQNTQIFSSTHDVVTFMAGNGAGATAPSGIAFCPRISPCSGFASATVPGGQGFIGITPGPNTFGGAFIYLRHFQAGTGAWFVKNPGPDVTKTLGFNPNLLGVEETTMGGMINNANHPWTPGVTNRRVIIDVNPASDLYTGFLASNGAIQTLGAFQGVATNPAPNGIGTGFKMTTGSVIGSDATPPTSMGGPFTFSTAGYDTRDASGNGNIQMIGGSVIYGGSSGNVFFRIHRLRMEVPEPVSSLALIAGLAGIGIIGRLRSKRARL